MIYFDNGDQLCKINSRQACCYGYPWVMKVQSRLWCCCHEVPGHGLPDLWPALLWGVKECCAFPELFKASKVFFSMSPQGWFETTTYSVLITRCSEHNTLLFSCQTSPPPFFSFSFLRIFLMFLTIELLADSCDLNKNPGRALWKRKEGAQRRTAHMFKPRLCRAWMKSSCSGGYAVMLIHSQALWKVDFSSRYHFGKFTNPVTFTWQYLNLKLKYKVLVRFYINHPTTCAWRI